MMQTEDRGEHGIDSLEAALIQCAKERRVEVARDTTFAASGTFLMESEPSHDVGADSELPMSRLRVGNHHVLIGTLGQNVAAAETSRRLRWYHHRAAVVRSQLNIVERDDLLLMLVAPGDDTPWQDVADRIEENDHICRKLVWRRPVDEDDEDESLQLFLGRTFLARPWSGESEGHQELDATRFVQSAVQEQRLLDDRELRLLLEWLPALTEAVGPDGERLEPGASLLDSLFQRFQRRESGQ